MHRIIQHNESPWLAEYINLNIEMREKKLRTISKKTSLSS